MFQFQLHQILSSSTFTVYALKPIASCMKDELVDLELTSSSSSQIHKTGIVYCGVRNPNPFVKENEEQNIFFGQLERTEN